MKETAYHHGNLKQSLIEAGIHMINQEGMEHVSLRKLAAACHVSHAAPYNHFKNKEELIQAIQDHITQDFSDYLAAYIKQYQEDELLLVELGVQYITYFVEHKHYYRFLVSYFNFHVEIHENDITCSDFSAFSLYRDAAIIFMKKQGIPEKEFSLNILTAWAIVEGLTSIFVSDHTVCHVDQKQLIRMILTKKVCLIA